MKCIKRLLIGLVLSILVLGSTSISVLASSESIEQDPFSQRAQDIDMDWDEYARRNPNYKYTPAPNRADLNIKIYRLFNRRNSEHLYTPDWAEAYNCVASGQWNAEGLGWYAPTSGDPVYRLYNPRGDNHLYTTDPNEVQVLTSQQGWTADNNGNPLFYSGGDVSVYRLYNPNNRGLHHLTTDENEYNSIPAQGWAQEGVSFHAVKMDDSYPNEAQAYNDILLMMLDMPIGTHWSYDNTYTSAPLDSGWSDACHAYALMLSDRIFSYLPGVRHSDLNNIKIGDIIRYSDNQTGGSSSGTHTIVVMGVEKDEAGNNTNVICAEGNWAATVQYGRRQSLRNPDFNLYYIWTRYP